MFSKTPVLSFLFCFAECSSADTKRYGVIYTYKHGGSESWSQARQFGIPHPFESHPLECSIRLLLYDLDFSSGDMLGIFLSLHGVYLHIVLLVTLKDCFEMVVIVRILIKFIMALLVWQMIPVATCIPRDYDFVQSRLYETFPLVYF